jgi:hypothetical protein
MTSALKRHLVLVSGFLAVAAVLASPALVDLRGAVIGEGGDPWQTMWRFEEQESRILNLEFWRDFFGGGEPRLINYSTLPWMPLQLMVGQPLAYNLVWLISFAASGYAMYLLVEYVVARSLYKEPRATNYKLPAINWTAAIAGLYYMLLPYHVAHSLGHFGAMQLQWLPLAILAWLRFVARPTAWNTVGLAAVLAIQAWTEHHYILWLALFFILYSLFFRPQIQQLVTARLPYVASLGGLLVLFVVLPYWPTIRLAGQADSLLNLGSEQTTRFSADLLAYITPPIFRLAYTGNSVESTQYLGVVALLLVLFFHAGIPRRHSLFWLTVALFFLVVSLGPRLHVLGHILPIPLPYSIVDSWPVFNAIRAVSRAGVMVGLAMAVLLGWTLATQIHRRWAGGLVAGLLLLDFMALPVAGQSVALSPAYAVIARLPGQAIVELPAATNYAISSRSLYMSRRHGKEVVGSIALERAADKAVLQETRSLPALRHLLYLRTGQLRLDRPDFFDQALPETLAETFNWLDVSAVVVQRDSLSALQSAAIHNFLADDLGLAAEEFDDVVVYPITDAVRSRGDGVFLARDGRWENVGFDEKRGSTFAEVPVEAGVTLYNATDAAQRVQLLFKIAPESHGTMLFVSDEGTQQLLGEGGDDVAVEVAVAPHSKKTAVFRNQLTQKVIIQDPRLVVAP